MVYSTKPQRLNVVKLPQSWETVSSGDAGYCYIALYPVHLRQNAASTFGPYPTWGKLKAQGGFLKIGFRAHLRSDGLYHITTGGAGYSAYALPIPDDAVLGDRENVFTSELHEPTNWFFLIMFQVVCSLLKYYFVGLGWFVNIVSWLLGTILVLPTFCIEVINSRKSVGSLINELCKRSSFMNLIKILVALMIITYPSCVGAEEIVVNANIGNHDSSNKIYPNAILEIMDEFDRDYFNSYVVTDICLRTPTLRRKILTLNVKQFDLVTFLEEKCDVLRGGDWLLSAYIEATREKSPGEKLDQFLDDASNFGSWSWGHVSKFLKETTDKGSEIVEPFVGETVNNVERTGEYVNKLYSYTSKTSFDFIDIIADSSSETVEAVKSGMEEISDVPAALVEESFSLMKMASDLIVVNSTADRMIRGIKAISNRFDNKVPKAYDELSNAVEFVGLDLRTVITKGYGAFRDNVRQVYNRSPNVDSVMDKAFDIVDAKTLDVVSKKVSNANKAVVETFTSVVDAGPWLTRTVGITVGSIPSGILSGAGFEIPTLKEVTGFWSDIISPLKSNSTGLYPGFESGIGMMMLSITSNGLGQVIGLSWLSHMMERVKDLFEVFSSRGRGRKYRGD